MGVYASVSKFKGSGFDDPRRLVYCNIFIIYYSSVQLRDIINPKTFWWVSILRNRVIGLNGERKNGEFTAHRHLILLVAGNSSPKKIISIWVWWKCERNITGLVTITRISTSICCLRLGWYSRLKWWHANIPISFINYFSFFYVFEFVRFTISCFA